MIIRLGLQVAVQEFRIPLQKEAIIYSSRLHPSKSLINHNRPTDKNQHSRNHLNTNNNVNNPKIISINNQVMSMINLPMLVP